MAKKTMTLPARVSGLGPVEIRLVRRKGDLQVFELTVNYSKADVPGRSYFADYCEVRKDRTGFSLVFGKLIPGESGLRTKIEVSFPEEMFFRHLWNSSRGFHEGLQRSMGSQALDPVEAPKDTHMVQTFRSNNVLMAMWGEEAVLDFYYISPRDVHLSRLHQNDVSLEPVIRVVLATPLMLEFLNLCRPHAESVQHKFPPQEEDEDQQ